MSPLTAAGVLLALLALGAPAALAQNATSAPSPPAPPPPLAVCDGAQPLVLQRMASIASGSSAAQPWKRSAMMPPPSTPPSSKRAAVDTIMLVDLRDPYAPALAQRIRVGAAANESAVGAPNSGATYQGLLAVAIDANPATDPGLVRLYDMRSGAQLAETPICAMPDMVTFSKDGKALYVACEGEPSQQGNATSGSDPTIGANPTGKFGIITVSKTKSGAYSLKPKTLEFQAYINSLSNSQYASLLSRGLHIDPRLTKAEAGKDIEPEYIALSNDGRTAYVTLQENNAIGVVSLHPRGRERITTIWPLGFKDWSKHALDPSDRDNKMELRSYKNLVSLYQPDTIVFQAIGGKGYLFIVNEGDSKEERLAVSRLTLDTDAFAAVNISEYKSDAHLGRLGVTPFCGIRGGYNASKPWNGQGPYERLCSYGGRSFSILDASNGKLVYDSGDFIERTLLAHPDAGRCFNCDRDNNTPDTRSDNSGPEPEAIEVFRNGGKTYAAVGLERMGGIMLFDVSNPRKPQYISYNYQRNFTPRLPSTPFDAFGDMGPEGLLYVPTKNSGNGHALLLASHETSGTLVVYRARSCEQ